MDIRTQRLNEAFIASGLRQIEVCERTGLTKGAISSYLSGRYIPKQKTIERLAEALNVPFPYLMGYDESEIGKHREMKLYKANEIAEMYQISIGTVYRLGRERKLKRVKVGRSVRFALPEMEEDYVDKETERQRDL